MSLSPPPRDLCRDCGIVLRFAKMLSKNWETGFFRLFYRRCTLDWTPSELPAAGRLTDLSMRSRIQTFEYDNTTGHPMPHRALVAKELADLLSVLSHPHRIRIIEELRDAERDVNSLQEALGISHSGVSQHLMVLRSHRLVSERRDGRRVIYQLRQPEIASWLMDATRFLEKESVAAAELRKAIDKTRKSWGAK